MKKAYIFPHSARDKKHNAYNPYIDDFVTSFSRSYQFINIDNPSNTGIFDIIKYIHKLDFIFFHWVEKLPEKKGGIIQSVMFIILMYVAILLRIKVIWTMHNKFTHARKYKRFTRFLFKTLLKKSHLILTHSSEGISFGESLYTSSENKIKYFPHPVKDRRLPAKENKLIDILIWGSIAPYKGIDGFLESWTKSKLENKYRIVIVGKVSSQDYLEKIVRFKSKNIKIRNEYISDNQLAKLINDSKAILFTYSKASILSSGALMDSIGYGAQVIGPHVGGFADLAKLNIVTTFKSFEGLEEILEKQIHNGPTSESGELEIFLQENTWDKYAQNVIKILE
ncbi:MAG: hypothetical protein K8S16_11235 [Bacteroidales bacterium]|nr:hypothetical protein [Bacteroidales bacterium]